MIYNLYVRSNTFKHIFKYILCRSFLLSQGSLSSLRKKIHIMSRYYEAEHYNCGRFKLFISYFYAVDTNYLRELVTRGLSIFGMVEMETLSLDLALIYYLK